MQKFKRWFGGFLAGVGSAFGLELFLGSQSMWHAIGATVSLVLAVMLFWSSFWQRKPQ